jgi:AraC-like DNA-binding protein
VAIEAERDPLSAAMMMASTSTAALGEQDWPDLLAHALRCDPGLSIKRWADRHGLASGTVSRGFGQAYGTSPARFRLESRAREACRAVTATAEPCAMIAADLGFADQAHMSRAVKQLSGLPPAQLRTSASNRFKTIQR